ncbi:MAG: hypothetical protein KKC03_14065 [Bacteroidetes bacterium]|nr:hypothetical protein [Bacteroidota bacterium]
MALGGIPVSGGITGHGTLIHTSLLQSPLLWATTGFWRPAFTLGGTAGVAGYAAKFVIDGDPKTLYKTASGFLTISAFADYGATVAGTVLATSVGHGLTGTTTGRILGTVNYNGFYTITIVNVDTFYFTATWVATETGQWSPDIYFTMIHGAGPPTAYGVIMVGHNLAASNISLAKFEGGNGNYTDFTDDLVLNADTLTPAYHLLATPITHTNWRIRVNFVAATALQLGEVFLIGASPLAFSRNFDWDGALAEELGQVISDGLAGVPRRKTMWARYWREFDFSQLSQAQYDALVVAARNGQVIFSPEGSDGCAYYGVMDLRPAKDQKFNKYGVTGAFTEAPK